MGAHDTPEASLEDLVLLMVAEVRTLAVPEPNFVVIPTFVTGGHVLQDVDKLERPQRVRAVHTPTPNIVVVDAALYKCATNASDSVLDDRWGIRQGGAGR